VIDLLRDPAKKARYLRSYVLRRLMHVNLQLLYTCNFRCQICDFWKEPYHTYPRLSAEQVRQISAKLAEVGPQIVSIGGGEPLLHPEINEVVRALAEHHFPVMICNGWFVTEERARALWEAGMLEISVSCDYRDPERHDRQRGVPGAHARALAALSALHRTRTRADQRVHMISVVMGDNLDDIEPLILLCRELGITYLVTLYCDARGTKERRQPSFDVSARLLELKRRYPEFVVIGGYVARFSEALRDGGIGDCACGRNLCNIDSQGNVSLCIDRTDEPVANILNQPVSLVLERLAARHRENSCRACWTSCRGVLETLLYGENRLQSLHDYYQLTRPIPLTS
jgi:MoaA/NifB/PqqE/SkfB family radical SAM enzyme